MELSRNKAAEALRLTLCCVEPLVLGTLSAAFPCWLEQLMSLIGDMQRHLDISENQCAKDLRVPKCNGLQYARGFVVGYSSPAQSACVICMEKMGGFELKWFVRLGKEGHYVICKIAEEYLTEDALAAVKVLLPEQAEGDLAAVCSWADEVRRHYHYRWSSPLHYVDTPDFSCNYKYCRDCHDGHGLKDRCVTGAIYNYSMQLSQGYYDLNSEKYNLTEALMFLSHFVGDVHQPLHVGFLGDLGGNSIIVRWYRRKTNLHHVWDTMIIESALKTYYKSDIMLMTQALLRNITDEWSDDVPSWENCKELVCPDPYASESIRLACKFAYRNATPGSTLKDDYFLSRLPVVEKRLAQSGVRLAEVLNRIFTKNSSVAAQ